MKNKKLVVILHILVIYISTVLSRRHHRRRRGNSKKRIQNRAKQGNRVSAISNSNINTFDAHSNKYNIGNVEEDVECTVSKIFVTYSTNDEEEEYVCERQENTDNGEVKAAKTRLRSYSGHAKSTDNISIKKLVGIDDNFIKNFDDIISSSGDTRITFKSVISEDNNEIIIDSNNADLVRPENDNRKLQNFNNRILQNKITQGKRTLVYVRITGTGRDESMSSTFSSSSELSRRVFGGYDDNVNLSNQMKKCSFNKFQIEPGEGSGIVNGVLDIPFPFNVRGMEANRLMSLSYGIAKQRYNLDLANRHKYHLVFFCVPSSTTHNVSFMTLISFFFNIFIFRIGVL